MSNNSLACGSFWLSEPTEIVNTTKLRFCTCGKVLQYLKDTPKNQKYVCYNDDCRKFEKHQMFPKEEPPKIEEKAIPL